MGWNGVTVCRASVRALRVSCRAQQEHGLQVQPLKACTGLDGRSPFKSDKLEFCSLRMNSRLSRVCELFAEVSRPGGDFSCCPVTWLEAEDDPCHLAP